jgi:CheY-like chemotaxis protein
MPRILIVEDEPTFADVLAELLRDEGYSVVQVRDGFTALNMLSGQRVRADLLVCDVMLPGLRGDRLAAEVRTRFPHQRLPILLLSASADPHVALPEVEFMPKPFETAELLHRIGSMLIPTAHTGAVANP